MTWRAMLLIFLLPLAAGGQEEEDDWSEALKDYPYKIVFETNRDGNWELYVMNADGSNQKNLTETEDIHEVNPKASPDGKHIAFCADTEKDGKRSRDVYYMKVDGTGRVKIADDARDPCWSPDGKEIAFLPNEYRRFSFETWATKGLKIHNLESGKTRTHPNKKIEHLYTLTWSPDGKWFIATVHGGMGYRHAIIALEVDGDETHNLRLEGCRADLTSDGKKVVWGHGDYAVGLAELDFSGEKPRARRKTNMVRSRNKNQTYHADWSPDGKYVLFSSGPKGRGRALWTVTPQCPGVKAPGWNLCVADASGKSKWVALTKDGKSNKEADWIPLPKEDK